MYKKAALALSGLVLCWSPTVFAFIQFGTYRATEQLDLRYIATGPLNSENIKQEVWIYQDGDGNVLGEFSRFKDAVFARAISSANGVVFIWPELRREALSSNLKAYCDLDYMHRISDLNSLIDIAKDLPFIDPDRIVLVGSSAGSEIVTWVANQRNDISAVVTIGGGVLQLADYIRAAGDDPQVLDFVNNKCAEGKYADRSGTFWRQLLYSSFYEAIRATRVPYLAINGEEDPITKVNVVRPYAEKLSVENPLFKYISIPSMGHGFGWYHPWKWNVVKNWTSRTLPGR